MARRELGGVDVWINTASVLLAGDLTGRRQQRGPSEVTHPGGPGPCGEAHTGA
jgi:hypothetical protein